MKRLFTLLFVSAVLWAQEPTVTEDGKYYIFTWEQTTGVSETPTQLGMNYLTGDVVIRGDYTDEIRYVEKMRIRSNNRRDAEETWNKFHYELERDDPGFVINSDKKRHWEFGDRKYSVEYMVTVPTLTSVALNALGGDVDISDLSGATELVSAGGDLRADKMKGRLLLKSFGGDIYAFQIEGKLDVESAGGDIEARQVTGGISITTAGGDIYMEKMNGEVDAETMGGDISLDEMNGPKAVLRTLGGDITVEQCDADLKADTRGGDITIRNLNGDGDCETAGGSIYARSTNGDFRAETGGGDIEVTRALGAVSAETTAGDIEISKYYNPELKDHSVYAITENGSVELDLPDDADVTFDLTARGYNSDINSDFDLEISTYSSSKKRGSAVANNGTHSVEVYVDDGSISIRKRGR